ncbi:MAG: hypothetical protein ACR2PR_08790 [Pseudohongiellaceae bacterium]
MADDMTRPVHVPRRMVKIGAYRRVIDQCLRRVAVGTMSNKQCETMIKAAKAGMEAFVAEQYLKQIGLDQMLAEIEAPDKQEIEEAVFTEVAELEATAEDLW